MLYLQRNGQTIPTAIQTAFKWLKLNALDQVSDLLANFEHTSNFSRIYYKLKQFLHFVLRFAGWFVPKIWCKITDRKIERAD